MRKAGPDNLSRSSYGLYPFANRMYWPSYPMKTNNRSSSITASWASNGNSCNGFGWTACGADEASGGMDIRDAKGADVCGSKVASGSHGAGGGASTLGSFGLVSATLGLDAASVPALCRSPNALPLLLSGLLVLDDIVSLVVTCVLSVLLSSTTRLVGRGCPEIVRLCAVEALEGCGDALFVPLESDRSLLKLSWAVGGMRGARDALSLPVAPFTPSLSLAENDIIVRRESSALVMFHDLCQPEP